MKKKLINLIFALLLISGIAAQSSLLVGRALAENEDRAVAAAVYYEDIELLSRESGIGTEHFYRRHPVRCLIRKYIDRTLDINKFFIQETGFLFAGQLQDFIRIFFLGTGSKPQACPAHDKRTEEYDYQIQNGKLLTD